MTPDRITLIPARASPPWFPQEAAIAQMLAQHQAVYRWRRPSYTIQLLRDLALLFPEGNCRVLDIGAGSGLVAQAISEFFPGKTVTAIDVVDRFLPSVTIGRATFDGRKLPFANGSFDCAVFSNVLHHVPRAARAPLVAEAIRTTGGACVLIKDHIADSALDHARLAWLDLVGNAPFGGMVKAEYLSTVAWRELFSAVDCRAERLAVSRYRAGAAGRIFPSRLEVLFRIRSS